MIFLQTGIPKQLLKGAIHEVVFSLSANPVFWGFFCFWFFFLSTGLHDLSCVLLFKVFVLNRNLKKILKKQCAYVFMCI